MSMNSRIDPFAASANSHSVFGNEIKITTADEEHFNAVAIKLVRILARQCALDELQSSANLAEGGEQ